MARKLRSDEKEIFALALKAAEMPSPALEDFFARLNQKGDAPPGLDPAATWSLEEKSEPPPS